MCEYVVQKDAQMTYHCIMQNEYIFLIVLMTVWTWFKALICVNVFRVCWCYFTWVISLIAVIFCYYMYAAWYVARLIEWDLISNFFLFLVYRMISSNVCFCYSLFWIVCVRIVPESTYYDDCILCDIPMYLPIPI